MSILLHHLEGKWMTPRVLGIFRQMEKAFVNVARDFRPKWMQF